MAKAKVCVMTSVHPPFDVRIFHKQCRSLVQAGYDVTLVVPHDKEECIDGVKIKAVSKPRSRKERFLKTGRAVYREALEVNADIYHIHDPELLPYAQLLRLRGKKVIYDMHENLPRAILTKGWISHGRRRFIAWLVNLAERFLLAGLTIVFAETSYKKDYPWIKNGTDILNMPDIEYLLKLNHNKSDIFSIGYVGGVSPVRGSIAMLEAISLLQNSGIVCSFQCIGPVEPQHKVELLSLIEQSTMQNICLHGYMIPQQAWDIISECHVGIAVLKPVPNYYGSYPTKMFEYMALGIPVIASNFPLYQDVIEDNNCGLCVEPESPQAIAKAIYYFYNHPHEAKQMGQNGRKAVVEQYNWTIEERKLLKLYYALINR